MRVDGLDDLPEPEAADSIYYLQDYVPPAIEGDGVAARRMFEDWRVIATRKRIVAAMARRGGSWITNVHQGGSPIPCE